VYLDGHALTVNHIRGVFEWAVAARAVFKGEWVKGFNPLPQNVGM